MKHEQFDKVYSETKQQFASQMNFTKSIFKFLKNADRILDKEFSKDHHITNLNQYLQEDNTPTMQMEEANIY